MDSPSRARVKHHLVLGLLQTCALQWWLFLGCAHAAFSVTLWIHSAGGMEMLLGRKVPS